MSEIRRLAMRLQNAAYRNGQIDAEDRWSDEKYREVADASDAALRAIIEYVERLSEPQDASQ